eukprot:Tbor_TRINITY_DN5236_c2_g5::TRINITY_DN5236_c2_g5_i1::g.16818::m.16818
MATIRETVASFPPLLRICCYFSPIMFIANSYFFYKSYSFQRQELGKLDPQSQEYAYRKATGSILPGPPAKVLDNTSVKGKGSDESDCTIFREMKTMFGVPVKSVIVKLPLPDNKDDDGMRIIGYRI